MMPKTFEIGKQFGRALGAAVILCTTVSAAMAGDCVNESKDKHAEYAKIEIKNGSSKTFTYDWYVAKGDDDYKDPQKSGVIQPQKGSKQETDQMHDDTKFSIKVALTAEWQDGPGITKKEIFATCEYFVKNEDSGNDSEWDLINDTICETDELSDWCESCEIACQRQFTSPDENGNNHWSTTFTLTE